jgi:hypothetical protein
MFASLPHVYVKILKEKWSVKDGRHGLWWRRRLYMQQAFWINVEHILFSMVIYLWSWCVCVVTMMSSWLFMGKKLGILEAISVVIKQKIPQRLTTCPRSWDQHWFIIKNMLHRCNLLENKIVY